MTTLIAYRTPPQMERKAAKEARAAGHRAYVPTETTGTRRVPTARGYLFADGKPHDAKHIKNAIGTVARRDLHGLYIRTSKTQRKRLFEVGDTGWIVRGQARVKAQIVKADRSGWYKIATELFGKTCLVRMREQDLAKDWQIIYDPG